MAQFKPGGKLPVLKSKRPMRRPVKDDVETKGPPPAGDPDRLADLAEMLKARKRGK